MRKKIHLLYLRSISPSRRPPSRDRPSVGCRVKIDRGPRALPYIRTNKQSSTLKRSTWHAFYLVPYVSISDKRWVQRKYTIAMVHR